MAPYKIDLGIRAFNTAPFFHQSWSRKPENRGSKQGKGVSEPKNMATILNDDYFKKFRDIIYNESGIHFSESNRSILASRLKERLRATKYTDLQTYHTVLLTNKEELKVLLDSVTTNLTRFFRNNSHFQTFENFIISDLVEKKGIKHIRIWSAGCSTGEEPYSIAISLMENLPANCTFEITASDLSLKSLMTANEGFYNSTRITGVPAKYLDKYFVKVPGGYKIRDIIKSRIKFDYHNLKFDSKLRNLDIIFCRNVLIYFDEVAQKATVKQFWNAMSDYSYLFIGHSESLFGMKTEFTFVKTNWACVYGKNL